MRTILFLSVLTTVAAHGEETGLNSMREKLRAKILESIPPPPVKPPEEKNEQGATVPVIVMKPVVVAESRLDREVAAAITRQEQDRRDERFSPVSGGLIGKVGPMKVGSWYSPVKAGRFSA